jgi:hypothetical protein
MNLSFHHYLLLRVFKRISEFSNNAIDRAVLDQHFLVVTPTLLRIFSSYMSAHPFVNSLFFSLLNRL